MPLLVNDEKYVSLGIHHIGQGERARFRGRGPRRSGRRPQCQP